MGEQKQEVPWAEGRRALIRPLPTMGWEEARAEVSFTGEHVWVEVRPRDALAWADSVPRAPVPNQNPCCFEVEAHTPNCARGKRIAENLARGVPAFWAEWAMWGDLPMLVAAAYRLHRLDAAGALYEVDHEGFRAPGPLIALGPDGPTLAPWGLK